MVLRTNIYQLSYTHLVISCRCIVSPTSQLRIMRTNCSLWSKTNPFRLLLPAFNRSTFPAVTCFNKCVCNMSYYRKYKQLNFLNASKDVSCRRREFISHLECSRQRLLEQILICVHEYDLYV